MSPGKESGYELLIRRVVRSSGFGKAFGCSSRLDDDDVLWGMTTRSAGVMGQNICTLSSAGRNSGRIILYVDCVYF